MIQVTYCSDCWGHSILSAPRVLAMSLSHFGSHAHSLSCGRRTTKLVPSPCFVLRLCDVATTSGLSSMVSPNLLPCFLWTCPCLSKRPLLCVRSMPPLLH